MYFYMICMNELKLNKNTTFGTRIGFADMWSMYFYCNSLLIGVLVWKQSINIICTFTFLFQYILIEILRFFQGYKLICCIAIETMMVSGVRN